MTRDGPESTHYLYGPASRSNACGPCAPRNACLRQGRSQDMSELTRDEVIAAVHPIDDATVAEIIATGASHDELVEACHVFAREHKRKSPRDVPPGRVGRVVSILERIDAEIVESWLGEYGARF